MYFLQRVNEVRRKRNQTEKRRKGKKREKSPKRRKFEVPGMIGSFDVLNYDTLFLLFLPSLYFFLLSGKKKEKMKKKSLQESMERKILV